MPWWKKNNNLPWKILSKMLINTQYIFFTFFPSETTVRLLVRCCRSRTFCASWKIRENALKWQLAFLWTVQLISFGKKCKGVPRTTGANLASTLPCKAFLFVKMSHFDIKLCRCGKISTFWHIVASNPDIFPRVLCGCGYKIKTPNCRVKLTFSAVQECSNDDKL